MRNHILITGNKGYVGSNLEDFLVKRGFKVKGYDIKDGLDILNVWQLHNSMKGCCIVYNCAAIAGVQACSDSPREAYNVNVLGAKHVVDTAIELKVKPILFSSQAVRGNSYYGSLKLKVEALAGKAVVLRPSNIYAGLNYDKKDVAINHFARDNPILVYGGKQTRDFIHISKVLERCLLAQRYKNGVYDLCSGYQTQIGTLAQIIATIRDVPVRFIQPRAHEGK